MNRLLTAAVGAAWLFASSIGSADTSSTSTSTSTSTSDASPYRFSFALDFTLIGLSLAGATAAFIETPPPGCLPSCEPPAGMNAIDRRVLGYHYPTDIFAGALAGSSAGVLVPMLHRAF